MPLHLSCLFPTLFILQISYSLTYSYHFDTMSMCVNPKDFECSKDICINSSLVCDGKFDCPNKSDEDDCGKFCRIFIHKIFFKNKTCLEEKKKHYFVLAIWQILNYANHRLGIVARTIKLALRTTTSATVTMIVRITMTKPIVSIMCRITKRFNVRKTNLRASLTKFAYPSNMFAMERHSVWTTVMSLWAAWMWWSDAKDFCARTSIV